MAGSAYRAALITLSFGLLAHSKVSDFEERLQYVVDGEGYADKLVETLQRQLKDIFNRTSLPDKVYSIHLQDHYYELSVLKGRVRRVEHLEHSDALYEYGESHRLGMYIVLGKIVVEYEFSLREVDSVQGHTGTVTQVLSDLKVGVVVAAYKDLDGQYVSSLGDFKLSTEGVVKSVELGLTSSELPPPVLDQIVRAVKRGYNHATARRIEAGLHPYVDVTVRSIDFGDYISQIP